MSNLTKKPISPPNEKIKDEGFISENIQKGFSFNDIYEVASDDIQEGGMGQAILCKNKIDKRYYVLKTYQYKYSEDKRIIDIFKKEIEFALKLEKYPHIVYSQTALKEDNRVYLVMELVGKQPKDETEEWKASTLFQELQKEISIKDSYKWAIEFCRGMQYLNSIGMKSHQDVKPNNMLITEDRHIKIADFGLVNIKNKKLGTEGYRSPEQARGEETDVRSDIYSFGVVLYELFNGGINPYNETKTKIKEEDFILKEYEIKKPSKHCGQIIQKCGEKKQKDRYTNFKELEEVLLKEAKKELGKDFTVEILPMEQMEAKDYFDKGNGYQNIEKYKEAIKNYNKAIELNPNYVFAYNNRGNAKNSLKQYKEAIKNYNKAIELNPDYVLAYNNLGDVKNSLKQYEEAVKDCDKAIKINPNYAPAYITRGIAKRNLKQYEEAVKDCDKAIKINPNYAPAYITRGIAKRNLKQYEEAVKDYNKAIKLDPKDDCIYNNLGTIKLDLEQYEEAIKYYNKALELNSVNSVAYCNRGLAKEKLEQYKEAIKDYNKAIELNQKFINSYNGITYCYLYTNQINKALKKIYIALNLEPNNENLLDTLGDVYKYIKEYDKAIEQYKKAIKVNNKHIFSYKNLIEVYKLLGKEKEAKEVENKLNKITKG